MRAVAAVVCAVTVAACDAAPPRAPQGSPTDEPRLVHVSIAEEASTAAARRGIDLAAEVDESVARVVDRVHVPPTPLSVRVRPRRTIPEVGIGGYANPATGDVTIFLDPAHDSLEASLEVWLPAMVAHELHHATRIVDGPGYGDSLTEAIVTEGLADTFSLETFPGTPLPPWVRALPEQQLCRWWARAQSARGRSYDHSEWFFGGGDVPRWAGYSLGFAIVRRYLRDRPSATAADLVDAPSRRIVAGAGFCLRERGDRSA